MTAEQSNERPASRWTMWLLTSAIVLATAVSFWPVARNGYINFDDVDYVVNNEVVLAGITPRGIAWSFTSLDLSWHPLAWMSHMIDIDVFGLERPQGMHLVSLSIHCLNAALLLWLLVRLTGCTWRSALVSALFALHPQRVESVAWIAERKDVLWVLFAFLTLHMYVSWIRRGRAWRYWLMVAMYALGAMSKPMIVTLPCVMLLLDYWPLGRIMGLGIEPAKAERAPAIPRSLFKLLVEKTPLFAMAFGLCIVTYLGQQHAGAMDPLVHVSLPERLANSMVAYLAYIRQMLWPADLAVVYSYPLDVPVSQWLPATLAMAAVTMAAIVWRRKWPYLTVGWLWFVGTLVPVIGIVQVGEQSRADRYTYFSMIGLSIVIAWSIPRLWLAGRARRMVTAAAVWLGLLSWHTNAYARQWHNTIPLFTHALEVTGDNPLAHVVLGAHLHLLNDPTEAEKHFKEALRVRPDYYPAMMYQALILLGRNDDAQATELLRGVVSKQPAFALAHFHLGTALAKQNRMNEASIEFREALRLAPPMNDAAISLAEVYVRQGRPAEAIEILESSLVIDPRAAQLHAALGRALLAAGRTSDAAAHFQECLRINPDDVDAREALLRMSE